MTFWLEENSCRWKCICWHVKIRSCKKKMWIRTWWCSIQVTVTLPLPMYKTRLSSQRHICVSVSNFCAWWLNLQFFYMVSKKRWVWVPGRSQYFLPCDICGWFVNALSSPLWHLVGPPNVRGQRKTLPEWDFNPKPFAPIRAHYFSSLTKVMREKKK